MKSKANCCVLGCHASYRSNPELTFHRFPREGLKVRVKNEFGSEIIVERRKLWAIKLKMRKSITINMRVCSRHFDESDYLTPANEGFSKRILNHISVPSRNLPNSCVTTKGNSSAEEQREKRFERLMNRRQKNKKVNKDPTVINGDFGNTIEHEGSDGNIAKVGEAVKEKSLDSIPPLLHGKDVKDQLDYSKSTYREIGTQADVTLQKDAEIQVKTEWHTITELIQTDRALNTLTGISSFSILFVLVTLFSKHFKDSGRERLTVKERIILVFLKLKLDLTYSALAVVFGNISATTCKQIFHETVVGLSDILNNFIFLPSKQNTLQNMPLCFKNYQNVRMVLACTEVNVQCSKKLCCKIKRYSHYRKHHTLKFMTAVTPAGFISYVSKCYGGTASDKIIFEQSNIINKLEPYVDQLMVDKGFLIENICDNYGIKLVRPVFLKKKRRFDKGEAIENRNIASARVYIERVNARIKNFRIFRNTVPLHLVSIINEIFTLVCGVVNLSTPIMRRDLLIK